MNRLHDVPAIATTQAQDSSPDTSTTKTLAPPTTTAATPVACLVTVETTAARVTFNGTAPSSANGIVVQKDAAPLYLPFAATITWRSTAGTASILNVVWLY